MAAALGLAAVIMCLFVELFSCLWPAAQDSQGRNGCFPPARLVCCRVCGWCAVSHFVLEKSRRVGRKERGRGVAGGAGDRHQGAAVALVAQEAPCSRSVTVLRLEW